MKLIQAEQKKIRLRSSLETLLDEFIESGWDCAEITEFAHKNPRYLVSGLLVAIKRMHIPKVKVKQKKGKVYIIKVEL